jgi:hypothetical protein
MSTNDKRAEPQEKPPAGAGPTTPSAEAQQITGSSAPPAATGDSAAGDPAATGAPVAAAQVTAVQSEQAFFDKPEPEPDVDPELMRLPRRPRRRRHPLVSLLVIALSVYLMWFVREDFIFFWQPRAGHQIGDVVKALSDGRLKPNTHVTITGAPDRKHSLILEARFGGYESFFRLLQTGSRVFVQQHRESRATDEVVAATHTGQLVRFDSLPYHKGLGAYFAKTMTVAHDLDFEQVARAKASGGRRSTVRDRNGVDVTLDSDAVLWINVAYPNEWLIQFGKRFYSRVEEVQKHLAGVGLPIADDDEESASFYRFVVLAEPDQVPVLLARFKSSDLHANVIRRQVSYSARWDQLSVKGRALVINTTDPTRPSRYRVEGQASEGSPAKLAAVKDLPVEVPAEAVLYITTSTPLAIAPDALVLLTGKSPSDNWYYVALYALLLGFILLNGVTLVQRLRERSSK